MKQEPSIEPSGSSKLIAIWGVILVIIVGTALIAGGEVYWWQKAVARQEQQKLQQQIRDLKNEIQVLRTNSPVDTKEIQKAKVTARPGKKLNNETVLENELQGRGKKIIRLLSKGDLKSLARYVHPVEGLRFSMSPAVNTKKDMVFSRSELLHFFSYFRLYTWGYDEENGTPVRLNSLDYYQNYVYDAPYADTHVITYHDASNPGFTTSNCFEVYPHAIVVEYRVSGGSKENNDANWRSIYLVFEKYQSGRKDQSWFLTGIIHEEWTL